MPRNPVEVMVVVPVWPARNVLARREEAKKVVEVAFVVVPFVAVKSVKVSAEGRASVTVPSASSVTVTWFAVPAIQVARSVEVACPSEEREKRRVGAAAPLRAPRVAA